MQVRMQNMKRGKVRIIFEETRKRTSELKRNLNHDKLGDGYHKRPVRKQEGHLEYSKTHNHPLKGINRPKEIVQRQTNNRLEYPKTHDAPNKRQTTYRRD